VDNKNSNAQTVTGEIKKYTAESPLNHMPGDDKEIIFETPLVNFADGNDPLFTEYKTIIGPDYETPREALARMTGKKPAELPEKIAVVSWILPVQAKTRASNRAETKVPSRYWSHTRWYGEIFNEALREHMSQFLKDKGYMAGAPASKPFLKYFNSPKQWLYTSWSERHTAYAAGLGTFGLSAGFITEKGIAHRCGSVITDMPLPISPRPAKGPFANCLFLASGECGQCIQRCPAGAITEKGHNQLKCAEYCRDLGFNPNNPYDPAVSVAGCGLCQTKVMCEAVNPMRKKG
jgi:epoxyqueuosine reductase